MDFELTRVVVRQTKHVSSIILNNLICKHKIAFKVDSLSQFGVMYFEVIIEHFIPNSGSCLVARQHYGSFGSCNRDQTELNLILSLHFVSLCKVHKFIVVVAKPLRQSFLHVFLIIEVNVAPALCFRPQFGFLGDGVHPSDTSSA